MLHRTVVESSRMLEFFPRVLGKKQRRSGGGGGDLGGIIKILRLKFFRIGGYFLKENSL